MRQSQQHPNNKEKMKKESKEMTEEFWAKEKLIKEKVGEAFKDCMDTIFKKAEECGLKDDAKGTWLFGGRVCNMLFSHTYGLMMRKSLKQNAEDLRKGIK